RSRTHRGRAAPRLRPRWCAGRSGSARVPVRWSTSLSSSGCLQDDGDDVLPGAGVPGADQCRLHGDVVERGIEAGLVRLAARDGVQELVVLDRDHVLEPDAVGAAGDEVAVVGEAVAAEDGGVTGVRLVARQVELELVEALEVPGESAPGAVDVEGHLAL